MRFVLCFRYGVLYHKTLGIPDCVPTPAPEYVLTAVIPSDLFLAPIGTPAGKLNFRGRKKRLFLFCLSVSRNVALHKQNPFWVCLESSN